MEILVVLIISIAAVAAVLYPLLGRGARTQEFEHAAEPGRDAAALDAEIARYRVAVRAGTVCARCGQANPAASRYCWECGTQIPPARPTA